jgi:hypothetical protein
MMQNSFGHGKPPKVSLMLARPQSLNMMKQRAAVSPCSVILRYAALKSVLQPRIFTVGNLSLIETMQCMSLDRQCP